MGLVIFDRQHVGNPKKIKSVGAVNDKNNDGKVEPDEMEGILTARYIMECEIELRKRGHDVIVISDGTYPDRHARVNEYKSLYPSNDVIYFACHINAGRGDYCSFFWDYRSSSGLKLARLLSNEFKTFEPLKRKVISCQLSDWTKNAFYTIRNVSPVAICLEPYFIDHPEHDIYKTTIGCQNIGYWIANAVEKFWSES